MNIAPLGIKSFLKYLMFLFLLLGLFVYLRGTSIQARMNTDINNTDQGAYLDIAQFIRQGNYENIFQIERNRMPIYPTILSFVYEENQKIFFYQGKILNIFLSVLYLFILLIISKRFLPRLNSLNFLLSAAFYVFIFRAAYVQAELSFYTLFFITFILLVLLLIRPTLKKSIVAGVLAGLAHLTKAAVLPLLIIFLFIFIAQQVFRLLRNTQAVKLKLTSNLINLFLSILAFFLIIGPYIYQSKKTFGSFFYNVNSTFYMWYDSWEEAKQGTWIHNDLWNYPDLAKSEIPSATKYIKTHTLAQMESRLSNGFMEINKIIFSLGSGYKDRQYGYHRNLAGFLIILFFSIGLNSQRFNYLLKKYSWPLLFLTIVMVSYSLLSFWYAPLIPGGQRLALIIFLPVIFSFNFAIFQLNHHHFLKIGNFLINSNTAINLFFFLIICLDIYFNQLPKMGFIDGAL